jgi:23S rRNA pseudouridine1911/1915/1917 synthase
VLDKPPGVVVHPTYKNTSGTLLNAVLWRVRDRADAQPGILTRLDKGTSGVVVIALTSVAHATMQKDAAAGRVSKEYFAIVRGSPSPSSGRIVLAARTRSPPIDAGSSFVPMARTAKHTTTRSAGPRTI